MSIAHIHIAPEHATTVVWIKIPCLWLTACFWEHACTLGTAARRHWNEPSMHAGSPEGQWSTVQLPHLAAFFQHSWLWHEQLCESLYQGEVEKATTCSSVDHQRSVHIPENKVQIKINIPLPTCRHNPLRHTPFTMWASGGNVNMPHPTPQCVASTCVQDQRMLLHPSGDPTNPPPPFQASTICPRIADICRDCLHVARGWHFTCPHKQTKYATRKY